MVSNTLKGSLVTVGAAALLGSFFPSQAQAAFITNSPDPFFGSNLVLKTSPGVINTTGFGFTDTLIIQDFGTPSFSNNNQQLTYSANLLATFFSNPDLSGTTTSVVLPGVFSAFLDGRTNPFSVGTWDLTVTNATFGDPAILQALLNPANPTVGSVTIANGPDLGEFTITSNATVFAQQVINGAPGPAVPNIGATSENPPTSTATPEPSSILGLLALSGLGAASAFKRKESQK